MGFRSDEDARIHRIDALEGALSEKDAEIARLKAELEASTSNEDPALEWPEAEEPEHDAKQASASAAPRGTKSEDAREVWNIDIQSPHAWMLGVGCIVVVGGGAAYMRYEHAMAWTELWPALFVIPMSLFFLHQRRLILDKRAGTVTRLDRLLFFSWRRAQPYAGEAITIERGYHSNNDGDSYWTGRVFLGDLKLFVKKEAEAQQLAQQIGQFLGIPCRPPSTKRMHARAMLPLVLTMVAAVILAVLFLLRERLFG